MAGKLKGNTNDNAKNPHPGVPLKIDVLMELIRKYKGNISRVADAIGTTRGIVRRRIDSVEELKQALLDERERWIDDIEESVLNRAADQQDTALQTFILKTQARSRGYDINEASQTAKDIASAAFAFIMDKSKPTT